MADLMEKTPLDLSVLGVGVNGHLGLNEPDDVFIYETHHAKLAPTSRDHPMLSSVTASADYGMTTGIGEIMAAGKILFLVSGLKKQQAFAEFMKQKVSPALPASVLWLHHDVTCICDREAAELWLGETG